MLIRLPNGWWVDPSKVSDLRLLPKDKQFKDRVVVSCGLATSVIEEPTFEAARETADKIAAECNQATATPVDA